MATAIATVTNLIGNIDGSIRELSNGDKIHEGESVVGDRGNSSAAQLTASMNDGSDIFVNARESQLFDASLSKEDFATDDVVIQSDDFATLLNSNDNQTTDAEDEIETAAGTDTAVPQSTEGGVAKFATGNKGEQDISAVLKDDIEFNAKTPTISVESAGEDGVYNAAELGEDGTLTATIAVEGSEVGDTLTYTVDGTQTTVTLTADNIANGVTLHVAPEAVITATLSDAAGNTSAEASSTVASADTAIATPTISVESAGEDGVYNAAELGEDGTLTATIAVEGSEVGDTLTYTVDGTQTTVTLTADNIANGVTLHVAPEAVITATLSDAAGNTSAEASSTVASADTAIATPTISVASDDVKESKDISDKEDKPDKSEKEEKEDKPDKLEKEEKLDKEHSDSSENSDKSGKEHSDSSENADKSGKEHSDSSEHSDKSGAGNDDVELHSNDTVDGETGFDTFVVDDGGDVDFSTISDNISNIEAIDTNNGEANNITISLDDVLSMTDEHNVINIDIDSSDTLNIDTSSDSHEWTLGDHTVDVETGTDTQQYISGEGDDAITVEINTEIHVDNN